MFRMMREVESSLLSRTELPAARVQNARGAGRAVLVCEHASRFIPAALNGLGLDDAAATSHAAWDIGAQELSEHLMRALDVPFVQSCVSRLVYDCNRPPERADAMPQVSEIFEIPGNANLTDEQRMQRVREVYEPFRQVLSDTLDARALPPVVITVHSFTPVYMGRTRSVELGILHDADDRAAQLMLQHADGTGLKVALNAPYSAVDGVTHTLREHAIKRGLPNVMIEVRNDLIDTTEGVRRMAATLTPVLISVIEALTGDGA